MAQLREQKKAAEGLIRGNNLPQAFWGSGVTYTAAPAGAQTYSANTLVSH